MRSKEWRISKLVEKVSKDPLTETPIKDQISGLGKFIINNPGYFNTIAYVRVVG